MHLGSRLGKGQDQGGSFHPNFQLRSTRLRGQKFFARTLGALRRESNSRLRAVAVPGRPWPALSFPGFSPLPTTGLFSEHSECPELPGFLELPEDPLDLVEFENPESPEDRVDRVEPGEPLSPVDPSEPCRSL